MLIALLICCVVAGLIVCETLIGQPPHLDSRAGSACHRRLPALEAATKAVPLLLAGIGLPLSFAHPGLGLLCLAAAGLLFGLGLLLPRPRRGISCA